MRHWYKEPLLHFVILGGLLFAVYGWLNHEASPEPGVVRITEADVNWLKEMWTRQRQRPPEERELRGLVADYLKEALLAREARDLGLEENDTVVRRRLAQKMEFLLQDTARLAEPGEAELHSFYETNRSRYQTSKKISFSQIYFKSEASARKALEEIPNGDSSQFGDPTLLEREFAEEEENEVANRFGRTFAESVFNVHPDSWQGPVASAYGFHLVRVTERQEASQISFEKARPRILMDWQYEQQAKINGSFFDKLLEKYDVVIDETVKPLVEPVTALKEKIQ